MTKAKQDDSSTAPAILVEAVKSNESAAVARAITTLTGVAIAHKSFRDMVRRRFGYTSKKAGRTPYVWKLADALTLLQEYRDKAKQSDDATA